MEKEYLSVPEAARLLGVSDVSIRLRIRCGTAQGFTREQVPPECHYPKARLYVLRSELFSPRNPAHDRGWVTSAEAAKILGIAHVTINFYVRTGRLIPKHLPASPKRKGWKLYFERSEVEHLRDNPLPRTLPPYEKSPTEVEIAYLAGLLDGEGSIGIAKSWKPGRAKSVQYLLTIAVTNTHLAAMEWIAQTFGGRTYRQSHADGTRRACYHWKTSGTTAYHILLLVTPHLKIKKEQAQIALEFEERLLSFNANLWNQLTPEELEWRERQRSRISAINRGEAF